MASETRVQEILESELKNRALKRFADAGVQWSKKKMSFFFPENENTVDLCALATLDRALAEDGTTVPKKVRDNVAFLIKLDTTAKDAVRIIALTTLQPTPA